MNFLIRLIHAEYLIMMGRFDGNTKRLSRAIVS